MVVSVSDRGTQPFKDLYQFCCALGVEMDLHCISGGVVLECEELRRHFTTLPEAGVVPLSPRQPLQWNETPFHDPNALERLKRIGHHRASTIQLRRMNKPRLRVSLPLYHTLIDVLLLISCVFVVSSQASSEKSPSPVWRQDYSGMTWDMQELVVPGPIAAISAGTLPVSVISTLAFPDWLRSSPFDLRWAGLHIVLGIAFWYGAGRLAEPSRIWRGSLVVFLVLRAISIPASMTFFRNHCHHLRHSRRDDTRGLRSSGFNRLRRKRLIESRSGSPYRISTLGRATVRPQFDNQCSLTC